MSRLPTSQMARKTLAEQLAELQENKTDYDIENEELGQYISDNDGASGSSSEDENDAREHYVAVPKSKLRKESAIVKDKKYKGEVTDRKSLYEDATELPHDSDSDEELSGSENDSEAEASDADSDSGASLRSNSDEESTGLGLESDEESAEAEDDDAEAKRERIKAMMASERKHIVNRLSEAASNDAVKGYAILQQHKEFDALIDLRLKVQKALMNSNLLPASPEAYSLAEKDGKCSKDTRQHLKETQLMCYDLLDTIHALRAQLLFREKLVDSAEDAVPKKRSLLAYLEAAAKQDQVLGQYRTTVLTKWLAKIQNSSGLSAMSANKFKALNQSAEQQVANNLSDMDRLVKRTKLNRRKITPLGYVEPESGDQSRESQENDDEVPAELATQSRALNTSEMELIFDDEDFYRVLLNDLVDKKIQSSDPTSGLQFALRGAASTKLKKSVDNKASKGRKLRFHVQEQIANFDAPRQWLRWNDDQIDEFFASLLGQKISMKENDSDEAEGLDSDEELVAEDSIKLFG